MQYLSYVGLVYGLATEIMNFGGSIINNAKGTYRENNDRLDCY